MRTKSKDIHFILVYFLLKHKINIDSRL